MKRIWKGARRPYELVFKDEPVLKGLTTLRGGTIGFILIVTVGLLVIGGGVSYAIWMNIQMQRAMNQLQVARNQFEKETQAQAHSQAQATAQLACALVTSVPPDGGLTDSIRARFHCPPYVPPVMPPTSSPSQVPRETNPAPVIPSGTTHGSSPAPGATRIPPGASVGTAGPAAPGATSAPPAASPGPSPSSGPVPLVPLPLPSGLGWLNPTG